MRRTYNVVSTIDHHIKPTEAFKIWRPPTPGTNQQVQAVQTFRGNHDVLAYICAVWRRAWTRCLEIVQVVEHQRCFQKRRSSRHLV